MTDRNQSETSPVPTNITSEELGRWSYLMHDPFVAGLCRRILELEDEVRSLEDRIDDDYR